MNLSASAPALQRDEATIVVTFPDQTTRSFQRGVTGAEIAASIAKSLARAALVVEVDGQIRDLDWPIRSDARVKLIRGEDPEALAVIRHDCAHVMAEAVQDLFPGTQVTIGPAIENGFYYDFFRNEPFSTDDLARIEARMAEIVKADLPFVREEVTRDTARARFDGDGRALQAGAARRHPRGRAGHALPPGQVVRPLPRPARAVDGPDRRLQADQGRGLLLARRRQERAAAADLRHGVREQGRRWTPTCTSSRRRSGATIASSAARWTCSTSRKRRRARCSGTRMAGRCGGRWRTTSAASSTAPAMSRSRRPSCTTASSGSARATGRSSARTCSRWRPRSGIWR